MFGEVIRLLQQRRVIQTVLVAVVVILCVGLLTSFFRPDSKSSPKAVASDTQAQAAQSQGITLSASKLLPTIEKKTVFDLTDLPYESTRVQDASLAVGTETIRTAGKQGRRVATYEATYVNGKEVSRTLVSDLVTFQPVNEIVAVGTRTETACAYTIYLSPNGEGFCVKRDKKSRWDWF